MKRFVKIFLRQLGQPTNFIIKIDIWSLGITIIEMIDTKPPHAELKTAEEVFLFPFPLRQHHHHQHRLTLSMKVLSSIIKTPSPLLPLTPLRDVDLVNFLSLCLRKSSAYRPSASELVKVLVNQSINHQMEIEMKTTSFFLVTSN